jgi:hypothetical protein
MRNRRTYFAANAGTCALQGFSKEPVQRIVPAAVNAFANPRGSSLSLSLSLSLSTRDIQYFPLTRNKICF